MRPQSDLPTAERQGSLGARFSLSMRIAIAGVLVRPDPRASRRSSSPSTIRRRTSDYSPPSDPRSLGTRVEVGRTQTRAGHPPGLTIRRSSFIVHRSSFIVFRAPHAIQRYAARR